MSCTPKVQGHGHLNVQGYALHTEDAFISASHVHPSTKTHGACGVQSRQGLGFGGLGLRAHTGTLVKRKHPPP